MTTKANRCHCGGLRHKHDMARIKELEAALRAEQGYTSLNEARIKELEAETLRWQEQVRDLWKENQRLRDTLRELFETNFCDHDEVVALLGGGL